MAASLIAGFVLTLGDLKAILFYASLLPVFIDLAAINKQGIIAVLAITMLGVGGVKITYAVFAARLASFAQRRNFARAAQKTAGALMIATGGYVAFKV